MASLVVGVIGHSPQSAGQVEHTSASSQTPSPHTEQDKESRSELAAHEAKRCCEDRKWRDTGPSMSTSMCADVEVTHHRSNASAAFVRLHCHRFARLKASM